MKLTSDRAQVSRWPEVATLAFCVAVGVLAYLGTDQMNVRKSEEAKKLQVEKDAIAAAALADKKAWIAEHYPPPDERAYCTDAGVLARAQSHLTEDGRCYVKAWGDRDWVLVDLPYYPELQP